MNVRQLDEAMGEIDARYVEKAIDCQPAREKHSWPKWAVSAACLVLVVMAAVTAMDWKLNRIELSDQSFNVTARYVNKTPVGGMSSQLIYLTEEELFTRWDTAIFKGTVLETRNIELNFNGWKHYQAIAEIQVEKVYRGPCGVGDTVSVLLPCPIGTDEWVEDTGVISQMRVGTTGIFMPMVYDESSTYEANGAKLKLADIAGYGFADGVRYAFLEVDVGTETSGLLFDRHSYPSISSARTLSEVEDFIEDMLERLLASDERK